jgi:SAM-dependent methyltransferase
LPFNDGSFDLVIAENVLEHVREQAAALKECYRVTRDEGILFLSTPNRFGLTPEPHVRVWGVGFLPRRWMKPYVKLVKGIPYEHIRILSLFALKRLLRDSSFKVHQIVLPAAPIDQVKNFSAFEKLQAAVYESIRKTPVMRAFLYLFGPFFHVLCRAHKQENR